VGRHLLDRKVCAECGLVVELVDAGDVVDERGHGLPCVASEAPAEAPPVESAETPPEAAADTPEVVAAPEGQTEGV